MKKKYTLTLSLIAMVVLLNTAFTFAQSGTLDKNFSGDGKVITSTNNYFSYGEALAIQSDGKIVVAGTEWSYGDLGDSENFVLVRYKTTGILDNTFGGGDGSVTTETGGFASAHAVAIQPDGKIVAAGNMSNEQGTYFVVKR